jgi:signal transduction histidine kinase
LSEPEKGSEGILGVPPEYEKIVFEPFYRLSKLVYEQFKTLDFGLGLTLIEKIIIKHGGDVVLKNIIDHSDIKREPLFKVSLTITLPLA